jgi:RNA polymerase sigma-70 factor (ECF subfamily)
MSRTSDRNAAEEFRRVALAHLDQVYATALYLVRDPHDAADLAQETFLRAYRFFYRFEPGTNCRAWLMTILHNLHRNRYRDERRRGSTVDIDAGPTAAEARGAADPVDDPEEVLVGRLVSDEVRTALESLPEEFRQAVVLVDLQDLRYEEAAEVLGCPIGTIRSRLSRGRRLLAERLREYAIQNGYVRRRGSK